MGKRSALMFWIFLLGLSNINAQVFSGNLFLSRQTEIDAFNYTSVTGSLTIDESFDGSIQNLNGLSELTTVGGDLQIKNNSAITNVDGLSNLTSVGGLGNVFNIENNDALTNINGLSGLVSIGGNLKIIGNQVLANIDGLSSITVVGGFSSFIDIEDNPALTNIDGLSNLTSVNSLTINNNDALPNIDALSNLTSGSFFIRGNAALSNLNGLSGLHHAGRLEIESNSALANLNGLSNLTAISGIFRISSNTALINIDHLSNLASIGGGFFIGGNHALTDLGGLSSLTSVESLSIQFNNSLMNLDGLANLISIKDNLDIRGNPALVDFCGLSELFSNGTIGGLVRIFNNGANTVTLTAPPHIIRNAEQGACSATISTTTIGVAVPVGCLEEFALAHSDFPSGNIFPVGVTQVTWTVTDGAGNTASAMQTITVIDNQLPTITCPANITVKCASDVPDVDINSVVVTDNCLAVISHLSDVISDQTCANRFVLTRMYKVTDAGNNTATCSQVITVYDDIPPQIAGFTVSKQSLWPPNHTMRDITLNYTASDNCVNDPIVTVTVRSNEPVNGTGDGDTDPDWEIIDNHHVKLRAERAANGDGRIYTITVTVDDGCNPPVTQSQQVMVAHNITGPQSGKPFKVGSIVNFSGVFQDKPGNTHTAKWVLDENISVKGIVATEPTAAKNGQVTGSYKFNTPGVYKLQMNVIDQTGTVSYANTNGDVDAIVVIYDPNGGNTYGGGYYDSPAGALKSNPSATGKASYGFAMNYFKNSTNPKGETQFEFKVGDFEFNALNFDYLVISNSMAQFKGTGKIIGGQSGVGFTMTVTDGQLDGSGIDKIRMKAYNKNNGSIIYDNQPGAGDAALPTQAVGANSIIVISGTNSSLTSANTSQKAELESTDAEISNGFNVIAFPNPSTSNFTINVKVNNLKGKITMQVVDMYGRIVERRNVNANSMIRFGDRYMPGTYFVRIQQGKEHKEIKLVKLPG